MDSPFFIRHSLKARISLATLAIFMISIWSLALYSSRMLREDMETVLSEQQLATASFVAREINEELADRLEMLGFVAGKIGPALLRNMPALQTFLEDRPAMQSQFNGGLIVYRMDGTAIAETPVSAGRIGVNYIDVDGVGVALKEGKSAISRPVLGKKLQAPLIGMTAPIRDTQGKVIGAITGARVQIRSATLINGVGGRDALASEPLDRQVKVARNEIHTSHPRRTVPDCHPCQSRT